LATAALVSLAACSGGAKTPDTTPTTGGTGDNPVWMALFDDGRSWTFEGVVRTTPPIDMGEPSEVMATPATCTVGGAHQMGSAWMSTVTCDDPTNTIGEYAPKGIWVGTDKGLWFFAPHEADKAHEQAMNGSLPAEEMLMAHPPVSGNREQKVDEVESVVRAVEQKDGAWCAMQSWIAGDEAGWELCFVDGGGLRATLFQAGATTVETKLRSR
jgi:hypothetical protein